MNIIEELKSNKNLSDEQFKLLLETDTYKEDLFKQADIVRQQVYGKDVYLRGLIEFTNYCKNGCYYCGINCTNKNIKRYRLTKDEILQCCKDGYALGYRTFVLQGGEDPFFTDDIICDIVSAIRQNYKDCAITLSIGEKSKESYLAYFKAGANRFLLRHETANEEHYKKLHPESLSLKNRKQCLFNLKEIGYQVGSGFMVGSPYQTIENIIEDFRFLQELKPDMIGIGPFIPAQNTKFEKFEHGKLNLTLKIISILRLLFPYALIPSTTALGTIDPQGRELGLKSGANVVMPNLSPTKYRNLYTLYDDKICTNEEAAECRGCLERRVSLAGYKVVTDIGNPKTAMYNL
ncbi:[FeFe] hydrogenase H-cluster radical SAM maturase HydE [Candidatus Ruminimicrobiellum ovillum]|uniref:[FeFe] hydrogenase H-cluster radical SAM maturase HydE n=1 Tax=Candidatus Ruminimicrobiellum ovillum TaxID=1947927 RepID=UPI003559D1B7